MKTVLAALALAIAVAIAGYAWQRMLSYAPVTHMRHLTWLDERGQPIVASKWRGCHNAGDGKLEHGFIDDDGRQVIKCSASDGRGEAFAWLDPAAGLAQVAWPLPAELPHLWTLAVVPMGPGRVGLVYQKGSLSSDPGLTFDLVAGVMARDGWELAPRAIGKGSVLGAALVDGALEVAINHMNGPVQIARLGARTTTRDLPQPYDQVCDVCTGFQGAIYAGSARGWAAVATTKGNGASGPIRLVPERGDVVVGPIVPVPGNQLDPLAAGLVDVPPGMALGEPSWVLHRDLTVTPRPDHPHIRSAWPIVEGDQLTRGFIVDSDQPDAMVLHDGDRTLAMYDRSFDEFVAGPTPQAMQPFARQDTDCDEFASIWLRGPTAGGTLVAPEGCYAELDASLARADPLSPRDELILRGGDGAWWRITAVLLGLPPLLALAALVALLRRRGLLGSLGVASVIYAVAAWRLLDGVLRWLS